MGFFLWNYAPVHTQKQEELKMTEIFFFLLLCTRVRTFEILFQFIVLFSAFSLPKETTNFCVNLHIFPFSELMIEKKASIPWFINIHGKFYLLKTYCHSVNLKYDFFPLRCSRLMMHMQMPLSRTEWPKTQFSTIAPNQFKQ